jgi:hypothetical protein
MRTTLRSLACALAVAFAVAAPASAQQQVTTDPSEPQAPVCTGTTETAPPTSCTSGDAADGAPGTQDDGTVGGGQVITDPSGEVDGDVADQPADPPKRGELHVLGNRAVASSRDDQPAIPAQASQPSTPAAPAASRSSSESQQPVPARGSAKTLPFTGLNAGYLALAGAVLLLAGLALRRRTANLAL